MATIRRRGDKWQVQVRRVDIRPLSKSFHLLKDAEAWARHQELQADRQELPSNSHILKQTTLGQLVERYRQTVTCRKRTAAGERVVLGAFLRHPICSVRLSELRTSHFADYRDCRLGRVKASTVSRELTPIRHLFEVARKEWSLPIKENPLSDLTIDNANSHRQRRLKPGELDRLLSSAKLSRNRLIEPIITFAIATGMRRGEILGINWSDLDEGQTTLLIPTSKNGFPRTIPLPPSATCVLSAIEQREDRVFPLTANAFRLSWEHVRARAGLHDLHFHDLRHEAISRFFELGLSVPEVALLSGHRDARMLFRYTHPLRQLIAAKLATATLAHSVP